jgi:hypothetical protein
MYAMRPACGNAGAVVTSRGANLVVGWPMLLWCAQSRKGRPGVGYSRDDDEGSGGGDRDLDKISHDSLLGTRGRRSKAPVTV